MPCQVRLGDEDQTHIIVAAPAIMLAVGVEHHPIVAGASTPD